MVREVGQKAMLASVFSIFNLIFGESSMDVTVRVDSGRRGRGYWFRMIGEYRSGTGIDFSVQQNSFGEFCEQNRYNN